MFEYKNGLEFESHFQYSEEMLLRLNHVY